ncbi:lysine N(6)-hydroxylase/L-ornithine N(5)-oxygenase family protein [Streptomyces mirabilis]|uniref:lysine N(6)-hydroxylase/L-ornithine N(5)-oxygenase family protein n=1 Tax=Streptomyces mirabilis TaxID=68239 RepID=UPI002F914F9B
MVEPNCYDVVGLGFGPANLALAIALEETAPEVTTAFFERQPALGWHRDMLLPSAKMQVSFLKDLATFRNPVSRFSFVSYLHAKNRLDRFVNQHDFFPTRREFHDYLEWVESAFLPSVTYGTEALSVRPPDGTVPGEPVDRLYVDVRTAGSVRTVAARNVVISTGLRARLPDGVEAGPDVWHSSQFLGRFAAADKDRLRRVAVIGAGQSAAELVRHLHASLPDTTVHAIMPSYGYSVADNTPFANQVFDASAVDDYYYGSPQAKDAIWRYHGNTNYSVVDDEVLTDLYQRAYDDEVRGIRRLEFVNLSRVTGARTVGGAVRVSVHSMATDAVRDLDVDLLVCATGYDPMGPQALLAGLGELCPADEAGRPVVRRDHRLVTAPELLCGVYVQGGTEHTHGLSSSLLSNVAVRGGEIAESIVQDLRWPTGTGASGDLASERA